MWCTAGRPLSSRFPDHVSCTALKILQAVQREVASRVWASVALGRNTKIPRSQRSGNQAASCRRCLLAPKRCGKRAFLTKSAGRWQPMCVVMAVATHNNTALGTNYIATVLLPLPSTAAGVSNFRRSPSTLAGYRQRAQQALSRPPRAPATTLTFVDWLPQTHTAWPQPM
eukprot:COSAG05_NODE_6418_length_962_cov_0.830823_2_plen_169_part_01